MTERVPVPEGFGLSAQNGEHQLPANEAARRLSRVLQQEPITNPMPSAEARVAICDLVRDLKGAGLPPERVLIRVKQVVAGAWSEHRSRESDYEQRFLQQLITWCIEEYYRAD